MKRAQDLELDFLEGTVFQVEPNVEIQERKSRSLVPKSRDASSPLSHLIIERSQDIIKFQPPISTLQLADLERYHLDHNLQ